MKGYLKIQQLKFIRDLKFIEQNIKIPEYISIDVKYQ